MTNAEQTVYEAVGGQAFFDALVDRFYEGVEADPALLALYPDPTDLAGARRRLALFLGQYWGGPTHIDPAGVGRWLASMRAAVAAMDAPPAVTDQLLRYFEMAAEAMRNTD